MNKWLQNHFLYVTIIYSTNVVIYKLEIMKTYRKTCEVFFKAMQEWNKQQGLSGNTIKNLSYSELQDFMLTWYVANGSKENSNLAIAVEKYGLGKRIYDLEKVMPGDFIDFSRDNNTGHTGFSVGFHDF